jgi:hypothetical protein
MDLPLVILQIGQLHERSFALVTRIGSFPRVSNARMHFQIRLLGKAFSAVRTTVLRKMRVLVIDDQTLLLLRLAPGASRHSAHPVAAIGAEAGGEGLESCGGGGGRHFGGIGWRRMFLNKGSIF